MKGSNAKNKKGFLENIIYVMVLIVVLSVISLICFKISDSFHTAIADNSTITYSSFGEDAINVNGQVNDQYSGILDGSMLFLLVGLTIVSFMLAAAVRIHPVFIVFFLIILSVIIILSAAFGNIYIKIANMPEFIDIANRLYYTSKIIQFLPWFVGIFGLLLSIVQYKNWSEEGQ